MPSLPPTPEWLLGAPVHPLTLAQAAAFCATRVALPRPGYICAANVHVVTESVYHPALRRALRGAAAVVPDGMPLVWFLRRHAHPAQDRVYGPDLTERVLAIAGRRRWRVFFYGGAPDTLAALVRVVRRRHPGLRLAGAFSPPFRRTFAPREFDAHLRLIRRARPDVLFVGLGAPKQEIWMARAAARTRLPLTLGVGAAFDFLAGGKPQAPRWMMRTGLEWAFRLMTEPGRLWRRYLVTNPLFLLLVALQELGIVDRTPRGALNPAKEQRTWPDATR